MDIWAQKIYSAFIEGLNETLLLQNQTLLSFRFCTGIKKNLNHVPFTEVQQKLKNASISHAQLNVIMSVI